MLVLVEYSLLLNHVVAYLKEMMPWINHILNFCFVNLSLHEQKSSVYFYELPGGNEFT